MARDEILKREEVVTELQVEAEALKLYMKKSEVRSNMTRQFFINVYKEVKVSLFLSEMTPNVCLLFNDGRYLTKSEQRSMAQ